MESAKRLKKFAADLLFPRRCVFCDRVIGFRKSCADCAPKLAKVRFQTGAVIPPEGHSVAYLSAAWAPFYYESPVKDAILRMKFASRTDLVRDFAHMQAEKLRTSAQMIEFDCIVPVPSGREEHRGRGYDVPLLLAQALGKELSLPVLPALCKVRETERQMTLSGEARRKNLKDAFAAKDSAAVQGRNILLVDDVLTTGSTLNECAKALRKAGAADCSSICIAVTR